jgi:hypothetical protein
MNEIDKLHQRDTNEHLGRLPSQTKVTTAIKDMSSKKAPGESGMTTNMLRNLPLKVSTSLQTSSKPTGKTTTLILNHGTPTSYLSYTKKRETQVTTKMETYMSKRSNCNIMSTIVAKRLLDHLNVVGTCTQFGHIGCQEALHSLRN